jgi:ubiquitin C-terminal hydrolase
MKLVRRLRMTPLRFVRRVSVSIGSCVRLDRNSFDARDKELAMAEFEARMQVAPASGPTSAPAPTDRSSESAAASDSVPMVELWTGRRAEFAKLLAGRGIVGIDNIGNTCYISSVLSALSHCPSFAMPAMKRVDVSQTPLASALRKLLYDLWLPRGGDNTQTREALGPDGERIVRSTTSVHPEKLARLVSEFLGRSVREQTDALEFFVTFVRQLRIEAGAEDEADDVQRATDSNGTRGASSSGKTQLEKSMDAAWARDVGRRCPESAHHLFGELVIQNRCGACGASSYAPDVFCALPMHMHASNDHTINSADQLAQVFIPEKLDPDWKCESCATKGDESSVRITRLWRAPQVLVLAMNRFDGFGGKDKRPVEPAGAFDMTQCFHEDAKVHGTCIYDLRSIVTHWGDAHNGHYSAVCRGYDERWYVHDDEAVSSITEDDLRRFAPNAYLMMYERREEF